MIKYLTDMIVKKISQITLFSFNYLVLIYLNLVKTNNLSVPQICNYLL